MVAGAALKELSFSDPLMVLRRQPRFAYAGPGAPDAAGIENRIR
ncbi:MULTISPECIES: hypothetical protein [Kitasatospora]|jgi:hypothetical protein|nr:hypothetical protein [Kitasatospora sp. GP30]MDH6143584.1 hypothetical protein [Kitasatospora sp. GP30]